MQISDTCLSDKIEYVQCNAALAITGDVTGISKEIISGFRT